MNVSISLAAEDELESLEPLFIEMYNHFFSANGITNLAEGGFRRWCSGYGKSRGVSRAVYIAVMDGVLVGFIEGTIRFSAQTAEVAKIGHVAHLYVSPNFRGAGIAVLLFEELAEWFSIKRLDLQTLDIVCGNEAGKEFWHKFGYRPVYTSYIRNID